MLRRIQGEKKTGRKWERRTNQELREIYGQPDIIGTVNSQRIILLAQVMRIWGPNTTKSFRRTVRRKENEGKTKAEKEESSIGEYGKHQHPWLESKNKGQNWMEKNYSQSLRPARPTVPIYITFFIILNYSFSNKASPHLYEWLLYC